MMVTNPKPHYAAQNLDVTFASKDSPDIKDSEADAMDQRVPMSRSHQFPHTKKTKNVAALMNGATKSWFMN